MSTTTGCDTDDTNESYVQSRLSTNDSTIPSGPLLPEINGQHKYPPLISHDGSWNRVDGYLDPIPPLSLPPAAEAREAFNFTLDEDLSNKRRRNEMSDTMPHFQTLRGNDDSVKRIKTGADHDESGALVLSEMQNDTLFNQETAHGLCDTISSSSVPSTLLDASTFVTPAKPLMSFSQRETAVMAGTELAFHSPVTLTGRLANSMCDDTGEIESEVQFPSSTEPFGTDCFELPSHIGSNSAQAYQDVVPPMGQTSHAFNDPVATGTADVALEPVGVVHDIFTDSLLRYAAAPLDNGWILREHQVHALTVAIKTRRHILALDMGLGKTLIGCCWARCFLRAFQDVSSEPITVIVVCPGAVQAEWQRTALVATGLDIVPFKKWDESLPAVVTTWSSIPTEI